MIKIPYSGTLPDDFKPSPEPPTFEEKMGWMKYLVYQRVFNKDVQIRNRRLKLFWRHAKRPYTVINRYLAKRIENALLYGKEKE